MIRPVILANDQGSTNSVAMCVAADGSTLLSRPHADRADRSRPLVAARFEPALPVDRRDAIRGRWRDDVRRVRARSREVRGGQVVNGDVIG
jgi:hypothetical protein